MTRLDRVQWFVKRLCQHFDVPLVPVTVDLTYPGWWGAYRRGAGGPRIELRPRANGRGPGWEEETAAHEFAHHLDYARLGHSAEPPLSLPEVRAHIRGTTQCCEDDLTFLPLELIPEDWRLS